MIDNLLIYHFNTIRPALRFMGTIRMKYTPAGDIHTAGVSLLDGFHPPLGYNQYPKSEFKTDEFLPRGKIFSVVPRGVFYESKKAAYVD